jgi:hypothetical protein
LILLFFAALMSALLSCFCASSDSFGFSLGIISALWFIGSFVVILFRRRFLSCMALLCAKGNKNSAAAPNEEG